MFTIRTRIYTDFYENLHRFVIHGPSRWITIARNDKRDFHTLQIDQPQYSSIISTSNVHNFVFSLPSWNARWVLRWYLSFFFFFLVKIISCTFTRNKLDFIGIASDIIRWHLQLFERIKRSMQTLFDYLKDNFYNIPGTMQKYSVDRVLKFQLDTLS